MYKLKSNTKQIKLTRFTVIPQTLLFFWLAFIYLLLYWIYLNLYAAHKRTKSKKKYFKIL